MSVSAAGLEVRSAVYAEAVLGEALRELTRAAAECTGSPVAVLTLVSDRRPWVVASVGLGEPKPELDLAARIHDLIRSGATMVSDLGGAAGQSDAMIVAVLGLRAWAAAPLRTEHGEVDGAVSVLGFKPRLLHADQAATLDAIARVAERTARGRRAGAEACDPAGCESAQRLATTNPGPAKGRDRMSMATEIRPGTGKSFDFGGFGVVWKIEGEQTGDRFGVVHHPMAPRALAAPLHRHHNEDEYSYVIEGRLGALLGDEVVEADAGSWVLKPRGQWHTFWNAGDTPCTIIEVISPAGFENYFREVADAWGDVQKFAQINEKYDLDMDFESVPGLCRRFGLTFPDLSG